MPQRGEVLEAAGWLCRFLKSLRLEAQASTLGTVQ